MRHVAQQHTDVTAANMMLRELTPKACIAGGRRMTVRLGSERHLGGESAVLPLPDTLPADLASAKAILGAGPRHRGSVKLETGGHLGGLALPTQKPGIADIHKPDPQSDIAGGDFSALPAVRLQI